MMRRRSSEWATTARMKTRKYSMFLVFSLVELRLKKKACTYEGPDLKQICFKTYAILIMRYQL